VLVTEWPEFADLNLSDLAARMNNPVLVDGRICLFLKRLVKLGSITPA